MEKLISISDDSMEEFVEALSVTSPSLNIRAIISTAVSRVKSIERSDVSKLVRAIISLYTVRLYSDYSTSSIDEFVEEICQAMNRDGSKGLVVTDENREHVKDRLKKILSLGTFGIATKAITLRSEYQHVLCSARILTDARPIYGPNPNDPPNGVVIAHTLKICYHSEENPAIKEIYLALDADDIRKLRGLLDRAESKAKSFRLVFDPSKLLIFD